jgi:hypothetical protein
MAIFHSYVKNLFSKSGVEIQIKFIVLDNLTDEIDKLNIDLYQRLVFFGSWGRKFFITKNGMMGTALPTAAQGDFIWIVNGAETPLILRTATKLGNDEAGEIAGPREKFQLVGYAYVDGLMYGEGYDTSKLQDFILN